MAYTGTQAEGLHPLLTHQLLDLVPLLQPAHPQRQHLQRSTGLSFLRIRMGACMLVLHRASGVALVLWAGEVWFTNARMQDGYCKSEWRSAPRPTSQACGCVPSMLTAFNSTASMRCVQVPLWTAHAHPSARCVICAWNARACAHVVCMHSQCSIYWEPCPSPTSTHGGTWFPANSCIRCASRAGAVPILRGCGARCVANVAELTRLMIEGCSRPCMHHHTTAPARIVSCGACATVFRVP